MFHTNTKQVKLLFHIFSSVCV